MPREDERCQDCGSGAHLYCEEEPTKPCLRCKGHGTIQRHSVKCPDCKGTGRVPAKAQPEQKGG